MAATSAFFIILMAFVTATLSGVFGMAGGLVLMGALALVLPVQAAFVTHGLLQLVANGWRAILHRKFVRWDIVAWYGLASVLAGVAVSLLRFTPSKPMLFLLLGLVPFLTWLPQSWIKLDAAKPSQAFLSGLSVTGLNLTAGVAGPLLDIFFVRTELTRHAIVATKAATQVLAHGLKIAWFLALAAPLPPAPLLAACLLATLAGTALGSQLLTRLPEPTWRRATRLALGAMGLFYLGRGMMTL